MYQAGGKIKDLIKSIEEHKYVLPAIQREFVWKPEQIAKLFDSLMQGYPFGTFLFWKVEPENSHAYKFYDFVRNYHERDSPHCPDHPLFHDRALTAVLDGQQRITALNIGLRGSMAVKLPNKWRTNPNAFPVCRLYLDLLSKNENDETGEKYRFAFLTAKQLEKASGDECWFKVSDILSLGTGPEMVAWLNARLEQSKVNDAFRTLDRLYQVIHNHELIAYYEEKSQDLEKVLNIFIRTNSGGTVLSYSDLLLSVAVAQWSNLDARKEIHKLVDDLNDTGEGFAFSQDVVLKAGLMLSGNKSVGFKVENFNHESMTRLESAWGDISQALILSAQLLDRFGFNGPTLRADSSILPIAYYLYRLAPGERYLTHTSYQQDREAIRSWLIRSLIKASGIWGSGLDTLLTVLRETIAEYYKDGFPVAQLEKEMSKRGKSLLFTPEEIEELADMSYGDRRLFPMLSFLFPFVKLQNYFHIDHIFPRSRFTAKRLQKAGVPPEDVPEFLQMVDRLGNLQLLEGPVNEEKKAVLPTEWLHREYPNPASRQQYCENHLLGALPEGITGFGEFYEARRQLMKARLQQLVAGSSGGEQT